MGIANFLGTLAGLMVGVPIAAAAAYFILSRLGSGSRGHLAPLEMPGNTADRGAPAHTVDESTADQSSESRDGQLDTVVADFADDRVPFRIVGETYDQQQKAKEGRARQQRQEILRQILEDNVALYAEISARRRVG